MTLKKVFFFITLIFLALSGANANKQIKLTKPEKVGMSGERLERVGSSMRSLIDQKKIPGTVSLISRKGKIVHFEANGLRDVARKLPMELDTIFRLYSQTKPVTGAAVMILFEEGHFLLTDPISKYLPEFSNMQVYIGQENGNIQTEPADPITIQQLLLHTSGLTYDFFQNPVAKMYVDNGVVSSPHQSGSLEGGMNAGTSSDLSINQWTKLVADLPLVAQPGTEWNYSIGMDVLGRLVEVISGKSYSDFLSQRIFKPLGMVDTGFHVPDDKLRRFAANYVPSPNGGMQLFDDPQTSSYRNPPTLEMGGSGLVGTVGDYLKFAQMLVNKGEYRGVRLLGKKTVEFMVSNHLTPNFPDDPTTSLNGALGASGRAWGVGFGVTGSVVTNPATYGLPVSRGLYAWGGAASTDFWIDHEEELVGIIHTQLLPSGTYPTAQLMQLATYQAIVE